MYRKLFLLLICFYKSYCFSKDDDQDCCDPLKQWLLSSSVLVELSKNGFHRDVKTTVRLRPDVPCNVSFLLIYQWPSGAYLDPYQLASLSNQSDWQILLDSTIDLEEPAHRAAGFHTHVFPSNTGFTPNLLQVTIPVHGRYHKPSFGEEAFASVNIKPPELLLRTPKCTNLKRLEPHIKVNAPCNVLNTSMCLWVQKHNEKERVAESFQLPVGKGSAKISVCVGTLLVTIICCTLLSKYMLKHQIN